jgi:hypothetical protein
MRSSQRLIVTASLIGALASMASPFAQAPAPASPPAVAQPPPNPTDLKADAFWQAARKGDAPGPTYELLATNPMGEVLMATPAISGGVIFVRSMKHVYAIGTPPVPPAAAK